MAIGKIRGPMLYDDLVRQGVDLSFDGNLVYLDVTARRLGVGTTSPQHGLDVPANVRVANLTILGNTITSNTGRIGLGSISSLVVTGGAAYNVIITDGAGNLRFGTLDEISGNTNFTGNTIELGANTVNSLSNALVFLSNTSVTDAIASLNQLLGNITNATGSVIRTDVLSTTGITTINGNLVAASGTGSNNTITGALVVVGGTGITGNLNVGGISNFTGPISASDISAGNLVVTGNINVIGNTNVITGNSGQFFGNAAGFGALYAGIPSGYVLQPQTTIQVSSNFNGYSQINQQNINSGPLASSDFIVTADNGTANDTYIDMGMASSTYNYPGFELIHPNDGYLLVYGNTTTGGGNLLLGTNGLHDIIFATNGFDHEHEFGRINDAGTFAIRSNVISTSTTSGAITVVGGVGVGGNLNVAGAGSFSTLTVGTANLVIATVGNMQFANSTITTANVLVINSNSALQIPVGSTSLRPTGNNGQIRYNTDSSSVEYFDGANWISLTNTIESQAVFTGDGSTVTFTLDRASPSSGLLVNINGTLQQPEVAYTVVGDQITFVEAPLSTDYIDIRFLGAAVTVNFDSTVVTPANVLVNTNLKIIDRFYANTYRSARYTISSTNPVDSTMAEIMLLHYNGNVFINTFGILNTGSNTLSFSANIESGNVNLIANSTTASNQLRIQKTYFSV